MPRRAAPQHAALLLVLALASCAGNPDAKRLYDDLLSNYNKLVRPVLNVSDALTVRIKLKLSQLIDVVSVYCVPRPTPHTAFQRNLRLPTTFSNYVFLFQNLKNQIMTTNLWVEQVSALRDDFAFDVETTNVSRNLHYVYFFSELVRLQAFLGAAGVWRCGDASRTLRPHLAARHSALQQVRFLTICIAVLMSLVC